MAIKVGVLFSQTGITSIIEKTQLAATILAIEDANREGGINGEEIEPIIYDPQSNPSLVARYARQLVEDDGVTIIFGCYMSSTRKALLPVVERRNALLCYPTHYEGFECSENILYFGSLPNQTHYPLVDYVTESHGGRAFLIGSDYIFPRESNRLMRNILTRRGGVIADEIYLSLGASHADFEREMTRARELAPDFIFSTVVGNDVEKLYRAFRTQGLDPLITPIASVTATEAELAPLPVGMATGHLTVAPYFSTVSTPENQKFLASFERRFGHTRSVNMCAEAAYVSVCLTVETARTIGKTETRALVNASRGIRFDAPQGPIRIDGENNHTYLYSRIGRFCDSGRFEIVWESHETIKPDPYLIGSSETCAERNKREDSPVDIQQGG